MKKKIFGLMFVLLMLSFMPIVASAATNGNCGKDGANVTWMLDDEGTLTISGEGDMKDYFSGTPWHSSSSSITKAVIEQGVTSIGRQAFYNCSGLESVTIPDSVTSIGTYAFEDCSGLESVTIGSGVKSIGDYAFDGCSGITDVYYNGSYKDVSKISIGSSNSALTNSVIHCNDFEALKWGKCGDTVAWFLDDEGTLTISGEGDMKDYPSWAPWCSSSSSITKAVIEQGVTSIGGLAFYNCSGLTSIDIPDSVTSIGSYAFYGCSGLTSVTIPDSVTSIGRSAFYDCRSLDSVYISDLTAYLNISFSIGSTDYYANPMCYADKLYLNGKRVAGTVKIPDGVTKIPYCAFNGCDGIKSVTIPDSVTSVGEYAFSGCSGLESVTIPDSVTSIGDWVFSYCRGLTSIDIPDSVTSIGEGAFSYCSGLESVTIPDSVTSIGDYAFRDCSGLESVTIGNGVTSIGDYAFYNCGLKDVYITDLTKWCEIDFGNCFANPMYHADNLYINDVLTTDLVIPNDVTSIGKYAFYGCSGLTSVNYNAPKVASNIFGGNNNILLIVLGDNVKSIDVNAFADCSHLKRIIIPKSVTEIEKAAFKSCTSLTTVEYGGGQSDWDEIYIGAENENLENANFVFNSSLSDTALTDADYLTYTVNDDDTLTITNCYENAVNINIPKEIDGRTVTSINSSAFSNRSKLRTVIIPDSVQSIGERAFYSCENLSSIIIPDGVTTIETNTFYNCGKLTTVSIPSSVTSIGRYAFYDCGGLTEVYYAGTDEQWQTVNIEYGNDKLKGANFHYGSTAPEPIIPQKAKVTKTDAETAYSFDVSVERAYENSYVYAVTYDKDGVFIKLTKVPLNMTGSTSVSVDKSENDFKAKVFVWMDSEQPISLTESFNL